MRTVLKVVVVLLLVFCVRASGQAPSTSTSPSPVALEQGSQKTSAGFSSVPLTISYQGLMTTSSGTPVQDGNYDIQFDLYEASVGGTSEWTEAHSGVAVSKGTFNVILGSTTSLNNFNFNRQMYLEVTATAGPAGPSYPITFPRSALTSAPSALAPWTANGSNISYVNGNVGLGTANPLTRLHIANASDPYSGLFLEATEGDRAAMYYWPPWGGLIFDSYRPSDGRRLPFLLQPIGGNVGIGTTSPTELLTLNGNNKKILMNSSTLNPATRLSIVFSEAGTTPYVMSLSYDGSLSGDDNKLNIRDETNSVDRVTFTRGGNVGIGTTSPVYRLTVNQTTASTYAAHIYTSGLAAGTSYGLTVSGGTNASDVSFTARNQAGTDLLFVRGDGNVGIGTTSPATLLNLQQPSSIGALQISRTGFTDARFTLSSNAAGNSVLGVGIPGTAFQTTFELSSGNVGIGTTSPSAKLHVNGTAGNNTGVWSNLSDRRLKKDIEPIHNALEIVTQLQGVTFRWKDPKKDAEFGRVRGLIAQEVEKVIPEWVKTDPDGYKRIEPIGVDALLIEAIKDQQKEIEELRAMVKSLVEQGHETVNKSLGKLK
ncbi:MAG: tail fiber domain-containing protein [Ignavibacteriae bacterium]|nr:tail fiber domain-containing protein [Ignavibacteriota bacterium]